MELLALNMMNTVFMLDQFPWTVVAGFKKKWDSEFHVYRFYHFSLYMNLNGLSDGIGYTFTLSWSDHRIQSVLYHFVLIYTQVK